MKCIQQEYGSEFDINSNNEYYLMNQVNELSSNDLYFFRSCRDTLKYLARKLMRKRVLLPALCCESMVIPFQVNNMEVLYYKLNEDFTPNLDDITIKVQDEDIVLFMEYFGMGRLNKVQVEYIREFRKNIVIVEDKTHSIMSSKFNDTNADFVVFSIRKWFAIPEGGVLYSTNNITLEECSIDEYFSCKRDEALNIKSFYHKNGNQQLKEKFRTLLADANNYLERDLNTVICNEKSVEIIKKINMNQLASKRYENAQVLEEILINYTKILMTNRTHNPLYFPIMTDNRDSIQEKLAKLGIYCPVIWPIPELASKECSFSKMVSERNLCIPCDQRYSKLDMKFVGKIVQKVIREVR